MIGSRLSAANRDRAVAVTQIRRPAGKAGSAIRGSTTERRAHAAVLVDAGRAGSALRVGVAAEGAKTFFASREAVPVASARKTERAAGRRVVVPAAAQRSKNQQKYGCQ